MANVITTVLKLDAANLKTGLKSTQQQIKETDGIVRKAKVGFSGLFSSFTSSPTAVAGAAVAVGAATAKMINDASDLEESINAVNVAYGAAADGVHALGAQSATSVGLSESAFNGLSVQLSGFVDKVAGGSGRNAVSVLDELTTRIADFASVNNIDVAQAAQIFQSSLAGETESLRRYGGDVSAAAVETFALTHGLAESKSEITESIKVQARYGLLLQETAKTAGDFANTSDGLANSQRILAANVENLSASFGKSLTPIVADAVNTINNLIGVYEDLNRIGAEIAPEGGGGPVSRLVDFWSSSVKPGKAAAGAIDGINRATAKLDDALGHSAGEFGTWNLVIDRITPKFNEAGVLMSGFGDAADTAGEAAGQAADEIVDLGDKAANAGPKIGDIAGALADAAAAAVDLGDKAANAGPKIGDMAGAFADLNEQFRENAFGGLEDDLSSLDLLDDIRDGFESIAEAAKEANDPKGIRDYNREVRKVQGLLLDYLATVEDIPPDKVTEIITKIRTGDLDTLNAVLEELTKDRFVNIIPIVTHDAFHSVNASFTPGSAPSVPTFQGVSAAPNAPVSTDARTIINYYPVGTTATTQWQLQQTDARRNGPR